MNNIESNFFDIYQFDFAILARFALKYCYSDVSEPAFVLLREIVESKVSNIRTRYLKSMIKDIDDAINIYSINKSELLYWKEALMREYNKRMGDE